MLAEQYLLIYYHITNLTNQKMAEFLYLIKHCILGEQYEGVGGKGGNAEGGVDS